MSFQMLMIFFLLPGIALSGFLKWRNYGSHMLWVCHWKNIVSEKKMYFGWHIIHYIIIGFIQTVAQKIPIHQVNQECLHYNFTQCYLDSLKQCLFQVLLRFSRFWTDAEVHKPQDWPNTSQAVRHEQCRLAQPSSCILKLARFLIHGSRSSATWQAP